MEKQERIFLNSVCFVLGFTLVFSLIGILIQTVFSHVVIAFMNDLRVIGGVMIIVFGILLLLSVKYFIPFFSTERKLHFAQLRNSYVSSFVFGIAFAIGWTPCVGPILGSIYALALTSPGLGFFLLLTYSLGVGIPFLVFGAFISKLSGFMKRIKPFLKYFNFVSGILLIAIGILLITGYIGMLSIFLFGAQLSGPGATQLNFIIALVAGVATFLSPCILPLLPAYFSYMAGTTSEEVKR